MGDSEETKNGHNAYITIVSFIIYTFYGPFFSILHVLYQSSIVY